MVISTIPSVAVTGALRAPPEVIEAAGWVAPPGAALVYLVVPRGQYSAFDAHYFPGTELVTARLSEPKNYRDGDDPAELTVLCAEIPLTVGDARWTSSDADLASVVLDDLARCGLPDPTPIDHRVVRLASVYPVYERGFAAHQATVERWANAQPGLIVVGRQALFAHDNTHHTLAMGRAAGAYAATGLADPASWQAARETFRTHVVED